MCAIGKDAHVLAKVIKGGGSTATLDPLLQVMHGDFRKFFLIINVCKRKRCTYIKGFFKTSSKSRIIKLLVNSRSNIPPPFTCTLTDFIKIVYMLYLMEYKIMGISLLSSMIQIRNYVISRFSTLWATKRLETSDFPISFATRVII